MNRTTYKQGDKVQLTKGPMGLLDSPDDGRFTDKVAPKGTPGVYDKPHKGLSESDWHFVKVTFDDVDYWAPVHGSQFEPVTEGDELHGPSA